MIASASYFNSSVSAKTADLIRHVWKIETRVTRSSLEAALLEAQLIRELKPPFNRMLKSVAPAFFIRLDLMDDFPRLVVTQKMTRRHGVMFLGPFVGKRGIDHSARTLSRLLGLRTCTGQIRAGRRFFAVHLRSDGPLLVRPAIAASMPRRMRIACATRSDFCAARAPDRSSAASRRRAIRLHPRCASRKPTGSIAISNRSRPCPRA